MRFAGMQKLTLLDVPGHTACTLFTAGCNLRCPFCHNSILVPSDTDQPLDEADILDFLTKRRGLLDGVCITGGEPLMHPELETFLEKVRALSSYYIKLDTNGTFPRQLRHLIDRNLLDMVAMDIKNTPEKYAMTCGLPDMRLDPVLTSGAGFQSVRLSSAGNGGTCPESAAGLSLGASARRGLNTTSCAKFVFLFLDIDISHFAPYNEPAAGFGITGLTTTSSPEGAHPCTV